MSSLRNAVKRKTHKERSQPLARSRFGLLEKKGDYRKRAKDFHRKERTIQTLRRKADERNPDEFYFGMQNTHTRDGVHVGRSGQVKQYSHEELQLMKTQDLGYIALKAQAESKKIARLRQTLHHTGGSPLITRRHVMFSEEAEPQLSKTAEQSAEPKSDSVPDAASQDPEAARSTAKLKRRQELAYEELQQRQQRHNKLSSMAADMCVQKQLMGKGRKRKLQQADADGEDGRPVFKWHKTRQR